MSYWVYILASKPRGTLYVGVTNNLLRRVVEHREGMVPGFTKEHAVKMLVFYEQHQDIEAAILREKRIKRWAREWKIELIRSNGAICLTTSRSSALLVIPGEHSETRDPCDR